MKTILMVISLLFGVFTAPIKTQNYANLDTTSNEYLVIDTETAVDKQIGIGTQFSVNAGSIVQRNVAYFFNLNSYYNGRVNIIKNVKIIYDKCQFQAFGVCFVYTRNQTADLSYLQTTSDFIELNSVVDSSYELNQVGEVQELYANEQALGINSIVSRYYSSSDINQYKYYFIAPTRSTMQLVKLELEFQDIVGDTIVDTTPQTLVERDWSETALNDIINLFSGNGLVAGSTNWVYILIIIMLGYFGLKLLSQLFAGIKGLGTILQFLMKLLGKLLLGLQKVIMFLWRLPTQIVELITSKHLSKFVSLLLNVSGVVGYIYILKGLVENV